MAGTNLQKSLLDLETRYWQAIKDHDADTAMRLTDDWCILAGPQGVGRVERQALAGMMKNAHYELEDFDIEDAQVQFLRDDVAVVAYRVHERLKVDGRPVSLDAAETSTWVRKDGSWVCAQHAEALAGDPFGRDRLAGAGPEAARATGEEGLVITRTIDAPREAVWKAWTDPERLKRWWGPDGFTTPSATIEPRPGGLFVTCMRSPEGRDFWSKGTFREVAAPERFVVTDSFADPTGNIVPATYYGMSEDWPLEALITATFAEQGGRTLLTLHHEIPRTARDFEDCRKGWNQSLDRLAGYLAGA